MPEPLGPKLFILGEPVLHRSWAKALSQRAVDVVGDFHGKMMGDSWENDGKMVVWKCLEHEFEELRFHGKMLVFGT